MHHHHQNNFNLKILFPIIRKREIITQMENKKINKQITLKVKKSNQILKRLRKHKGLRLKSQRLFNQKITAAANNLLKKNQMNKKNTIQIFQI